MDRAQIIAELFENMHKLKRSWAKHHAICKLVTRAQMSLMMILFHEGKQSIKELAKRLEMTSSAATQMVDGLVKNGLLQREEDAQDRRKIAVSLTKNGQQQLKKAKKLTYDNFAKALESLNDQELSQLNILHQKIISHLK